MDKSTEKLRDKVDEEISSISSKYRYSQKSTEKILILFNQWLEEQGATYLEFVKCDDGYERRDLVPLRLGGTG